MYFICKVYFKNEYVAPVYLTENVMSSIEALVDTIVDGSKRCYHNL